MSKSKKKPKKQRKPRNYEALNALLRRAPVMTNRNEKRKKNKPDYLNDEEG